MATNFYIYYRVAEGSQALARQRVIALLDHVCSRSGVRGRLMSKRSESDLWMEVYEGVPDETDFEAILATGARELALDEVLMPGWSRRVECFED
jgi:hypothetical protein